ncbi:MAG: DegT/DnrJ/EryC1/StrS family aminotransferase [Flavobacteriales bacterium]|nr:DegT/DnrJ/EryC1/StrS family aminotransferase [Flavobacteriales bacterium]
MDQPVFPRFLQEQLLASCTSRDQLAGCGAVHTVERRLAAHYGKRFALLTNNATTALMAVALATRARFEPVIVNPFTWPGAVAPFTLLGSRVMLAPVQPHDLNMDLGALYRAGCEEARVLLVNDQGGTAADQERARTYADVHGMVYVHDAACSLGTVDPAGRPAGSLADVVVTSFGPDKAITAGEGGAIVCDDEELYQRLLALCMHPERQRKEVGTHHVFGPLNARPHPLAATVLAGSWDLQFARLKERQAVTHRWLLERAHCFDPGSLPGREGSTYCGAVLPLRKGSTAGLKPCRPVPMKPGMAFPEGTWGRITTSPVAERSLRAIGRTRYGLMDQHILERACMFC